MAQEKYTEAIKQIKEIFIKLFEEEPTPDDEIEAKEYLLNLLRQLLNNISGFENKEDLIQETLKIVENWDTLDLWFKEVNGLTENIKKLIEYREKSEIKKKIEEFIQESDEETETTPEFDIKETISQVSDDFKGEISKLKNYISDLEKKLGEKDREIKDVKKKPSTRAPPEFPVKPKKKSRLQPPKVIIPKIGAPLIQRKKESAPRKEEKVETKELKKIKAPKIEIAPILDEKPKIGIVSSKKSHFTPLPKKKIKIGGESVIQPTEKPISKKRPKITHVFAEEIEVTPKEEEEKVKVLPFSDTISKTEPSSAKKMKISNIPEGETTPIPKKPKITPVELEEMDLSSTTGDQTEEQKRISSKKLYNVFSSASSVETKSKQKEQKKVIEPTQETLTSGSIIDTQQLQEGSFTYNKDKLYQDLIVLEGKRYSIEKTQKESETKYKKGELDDLAYKREMDKIRAHMGKITSKINEIRKVIQGL